MTNWPGLIAGDGERIFYRAEVLTVREAADSAKLEAARVVMLQWLRQWLARCPAVRDFRMIEVLRPSPIAGGEPLIDIRAEIVGPADDLRRALGTRPAAPAAATP